MLRATCLDDAALVRPMVGIVASRSDVSPCNLTLRELAGDVGEGGEAAGAPRSSSGPSSSPTASRWAPKACARACRRARDDRRLDQARGRGALPQCAGDAGRLRLNAARSGDGRGPARAGRCLCRQRAGLRAGASGCASRRQGRAPPMSSPRSPTLFLLDNQALGMVRQWQDLFFAARFSEVDLSDNPDFVALARGSGLRRARSTARMRWTARSTNCLPRRRRCCCTSPFRPRQGSGRSSRPGGARSRC